MKTLQYCALLLVLAFFCSTLFAQEESLSSSSTNSRVALIIGNADYNFGPLLNPENDARAMASALRKTGFTVFEHVNVKNMAEMKKAIREFGREIKNGGVGLFYYAGHGIQVNGKNYLIPTQAEIYAEEEIEYEAVDVGFVLAQMEIAQNRMNILILDACRNNPFARSWRSAGTGLAFINAPTGTLIAYSTAPGSVASDGTGSNGLYTEELLKQISREGQKIEDVFKSVRSGVIDRSNNLQTPWESSSLIGDFYFIRPADAQTDQGSYDHTAEILAPTGQAKWKKSGNGYLFYQAGVDLTSETTTCSVESDGLLYDKATNRNYLLEDFWNTKDEELRVAKEIISSSNAFWRKNERNEFRFYFEGSELTNTLKSAWFNDDILVFLEEGNKYFRLPDFKNIEDSRLMKAEPVFSSNHTLWWAKDGYFYLYVRGDQIAQRTYWQWTGNDLIVYDHQGQSSYRFPDYYNNSDGILRPAEILVAPGEITWSKNANNTFWLQRNSVDFDALDVANEYFGNHMLLFEKITQQDFLLKDYLVLENDVQYPALSLWSKYHAFWTKSDDAYTLYVNGEIISGRTTAETVNQDIEVHDPETGTTWILKDYFTLGENILVPAIVKE